MSFFPPNKDFYENIQGEKFARLLTSNATTDKGLETIARYYDVYDEWVALEHCEDKIEKYYELLFLVKTKSKNDNVWVSFIEGLHRHAATIACLLCIKFDYDKNIINLGSLDLDDFKNADVPHYKDPGYNPRQCLLLILNGDTEAPMLTSLFTFQACIPKEIDGDIQPIMDNLRAYSEWVSISKIDSAQKTISKTLWSWLSDMMKYSAPTRRNCHDICPQWLDTDMFTYQDNMTEDKYTKATADGKELTALGFSRFVTSDEWTEYIRNPFDVGAGTTYLQYMSGSCNSRGGTSKQTYPPYGLTFASFTTDVGVVDVRAKRCKIDASHANAFLIIPGIVYHLSATLDKGNIHDHLGQMKIMRLIQFLCRYGYATRKGPTVMTPIAYTRYCENINDAKFLQGCYGYYQLFQ